MILSRQIQCFSCIIVLMLGSLSFVNSQTIDRDSIYYKAKSLFLLGHKHLLAGEYIEASPHLDTLILSFIDNPYYDTIFSENQKFLSYHYYSASLLGEDKDVEAFIYFQKALDLYESCDSITKNELANPLTNLYWNQMDAYKFNFQFNQALELGIKNLKIAQQYNFDIMVAKQIIALASICIHLGEQTIASNYLKSVEQILSKNSTLKFNWEIQLDYYYTLLELDTIPILPAKIISLMDSTYQKYHTEFSNLEQTKYEINYVYALNLLKNKKRLKKIISQNGYPDICDKTSTGKLYNLFYLKQLNEIGRFDEARQFAQTYIINDIRKDNKSNPLGIQYIEYPLRFIKEYILSLIGLANNHQEFLSKEELQSEFEAIILDIHSSLTVQNLSRDIKNRNENEQQLLSHSNQLFSKAIDLLAVYAKKYDKDDEFKKIVWNIILNFKSISSNRLKITQSSSLLPVEINRLKQLELQLDTIIKSQQITPEKRNEKSREILDSIKHEFPLRHKLYSLTYSNTFEKFTQMSDSLNMEYLSFNIGDTYVLSLLLNDQALQLYSTKYTDSLDTWVENVLNISKEGKGIFLEQDKYFELVDSYQQSAFQLYQTIIGDLSPKKGKPLQILSSSRLRGISFGQLCSEIKRHKPTFADLAYIEKSYHISHFPGLNPRNNSFKGDVNVAYFRPSYSEKLQLGNSSIPNTLQTLFPISQWIGKEATKASIIHALENFAIIHFDGHSVANSYNPSQSYLALNKDSKNGDFMNGIDIQVIHSNAVLLYLNSCESLGNKTHITEGIMGLARNFSLSGVSNIIAMRWKVKDLQSDQFAQSFYSLLERGKSIAESLHETKLEILNKHDPVLSHPYYWAGVHLYGNGNQENSKNYSSKTYLLVGIILCLILIPLLIKKTG